jgi:hypothetical protein
MRCLSGYSLGSLAVAPAVAGELGEESVHLSSPCPVVERATDR